MKTLKLYAGAFAVFTLLFAGIIRDDQSEQKHLKLGAQKQFDCVGQLFKGGKPSGSAVLIGKRKVLTAAHCLYNYITKPDTMLLNKQQVIVFPVVDAKVIGAEELLFKVGGTVYTVKSIKIYKDYDWAKTGLDLALIELVDDVEQVVPARLNKRFDELGSDIIGVGFGASGQAGRASKVVAAGIKIAGQNVVDSLGGKKINNEFSLLVCDFDSPTNPSLNKTGSSIAKPLEYICSGGDSGGGMFRYHKGSWELIGICSSSDSGIGSILKNSYYGLTMSWSRVAAFKGWIDGAE